MSLHVGFGCVFVVTGARNAGPFLASCLGEMFVLFFAGFFYGLGLLSDAFVRL